MFDVTNCAVTIDIIIMVFGMIGLCLIWSRYFTALFIGYLFSMYWVYTLYQTDLLQMMGQNAFYWSGAGSLALGSILWAIINVMPGRY